MNLMKRKQVDWFPSIFEDLFNDSRLANIANFGSTLPAVNIKETEKEFLVEVAVPGKSKDDFNIELNEDVLTISSEMKTENTETSEDGRYTRREFSYNAFKRAFHLPDTVEQDNIKATYDNGVLQIHVPKKAEVIKSRAKRMIAVS